MADEEKKNEQVSKEEVSKSEPKAINIHQWSTTTTVVVVLAVLVALGFVFSLGRITERRGVRRTVVNSARTAPMRGRAMTGRRGDWEQGSVLNLATVSKIDGNTMTVNSNNKDYTVTITADTSIIKSGEIAKQSDIQVKDQVSVRGSSKSDGSIVATAIVVR